ncbi:serine/threonine protein kinase [Myxococcota bacterium]
MRGAVCAEFCGRLLDVTTPVIGRYEVRSGLGRGAMGSVYLAFDPKMGREVAIKVLQREFAQSTKHRARFDREARAIAALRHPNIVEIYDYGGSPDDHLYLVMEFIAGPHVGKVVRDNGPFPESVLAAVGVELTAALGHAHQSGIIHRDLKPENVFIDKGRLVLADFGIVKAITSDNPLGAAAATPRTDVIGTPGFMAPEQLVQDPLDARTDVFSLGSLMYYLATLKLPYDAESPYALLKEFRETRPTPLADVRPDLSDTISALVQDCLEVNQDFRPKDVEIVRRRLRQALDQLGARDAREILARFETNPDGFREQDKERTIGHLIEQLKIAVRDGDGILADGVRGRIGVLDPNNAEAQRITGAAHLSKSAVDTDPELVIKRGRRRQKVFWGGAVSLSSWPRWSASWHST